MSASTSTVYGIKYCDGEYGAFGFGLFDDLELARAHYEKTKANVIHMRYDPNECFGDLPIETFGEYAETDAIMIVLYSFDVNNANEWTTTDDGYFHGWESLNDHINIIAFSQLMFNEE